MNNTIRNFETDTIRKRFYFPILFLIICTSMISCIESEFNAKDIMVKQEAEDGYVWYLFKYNGKYGIADVDGEVLTLPKYDKIYYVSGDGYFEMKLAQEKQKDSLIAIETKEHEKKVLLQQEIQEYTKMDAKDKTKNHFRTHCKKGEDSWWYGVYDKHWNVIVPCTAKFHYTFYRDTSKDEGMERFCNSYPFANRSMNLPLSVRLDEEGDVVYVKEDLEYINIYEMSLYKGNHCGVYVVFCFYNDFIIDYNNKKYTYWGRDDENNKIFRRETDSYTDSYIVDENYNIKNTFYYEQQYDYDGSPIIWHCYDKLKEYFEEYREDLIKTLKREIDDDAKLFAIMKKAANNHFWNKEFDENKVIQDYKDAHEYEIEKLQKNFESTLEFYNIKTERGRNRVGGSGTRMGSQEAMDRAVEETNSHRSSEKIMQEHQRQLVPVQEWVPCGSCQGTGKCPQCNGTGQNFYNSSNPYEPCLTCGRAGRCVMCAGQCGHYQTFYR